MSAWGGPARSLEYLRAAHSGMSAWGGPARSLEHLRAAHSGMSAWGGPARSLEYLRAAHSGMSAWGGPARSCLHRYGRLRQRDRTLARHEGAPRHPREQQRGGGDERERPPHRVVPLGLLLRAQFGVEAVVQRVVVDEQAELAVRHPLLEGARRIREVAPSPGRVLARDVDHLVDQLLPRRPVLHLRRLPVALVVFGVLVVGRVLALEARLRVRPVH